MCVAENHGILPLAGEAAPARSSGGGDAGVDATTLPFVTQTWDWQAPIARYMKVPFEESGTLDERSSASSRR
jgi:hypothetical protein